MHQPKAVISAGDSRNDAAILNAKTLTGPDESLVPNYPIHVKVNEALKDQLDQAPNTLETVGAKELAKGLHAQWNKLHSNENLLSQALHFSAAA